MSIFKDVVALANAGWKPSDIMELMKMESNPENSNNDADKDSENKSQDKEPDKEPDYKSLYEAKCKELKDIQSENTKENVVDNDISIYDVITDIKKSIS